MRTKWVTSAGTRPVAETEEAAPAAPSLAWQRDVPESLRSLDGLARPDYADLFTARANGVSEQAAEEWARAALEGAPDHLRLAAVLAQRLLLGLRLGPLRSPNYILGWKIAERGNDWVRIEATSWMMAASLVFKVDEVGLSVATFVRYDRRLAAVIWPPISIVHRKVGLAMMRHALRTPRRAIAKSSAASGD
jgi:hypothetical protein